MLKGIIPIVAAPFTNTGLLDEDSFANLIAHLSTTGVHGITLFGLATEFYKLTDHERRRMVNIFLAELKKHEHVTSMISVTDHTKETAAIHAKMLEQLGVDCIMLLPPFFLQPSVDSIMEHIKAVAEAVSVPIVVQYAPSQTGVRIEPEVFLKLNEQYEHIRYVKVETQPPGRYVSRLYQESGGKLETLVGYAGIQMPDVLMRGASGIQPGCSYSEIYMELYRRYEQQKEEEFRVLFQELLPFIAYWMQGVELIIKAEKIILKKRRIIESDYCRSPDYRMDFIEMEMIERFLDKFSDFFK